MSLSQTQLDIIDVIDEDAKASHWRDWKWQIAHSIHSIDDFERLLDMRLAPEKKLKMEATIKKFPVSVTPYYLSLIDVEDWENDPICKQAMPSPLELVMSRADMVDPLHEDKDSPAPGITHRYPDRVLFLVSGLCSMYCRHCTRKRRVGDVDQIPSKKDMLAGIDYIRKTPQVRDVLLSGGDPFMLSDERLDWLLGELGTIKHLEVIRIGTRMPVVLP